MYKIAYYYLSKFKIISFSLIYLLILCNTQPLFAEKSLAPPKKTIQRAGDLEHLEKIAETPPLTLKPFTLSHNLLSTFELRLVSSYNHYGLNIGPYFADKQLYTQITPQITRYDLPITFSFQLPLNLITLKFTEQGVKTGNFKIKKEDYDDFRDLARLINFSTLGDKHSKFYLALDSLSPATLGYGFLINRYQANIDNYFYRLSLQLETSWQEALGFKAYLSDLTFKHNLLGTLAFITPIKFFQVNLKPTPFNLWLRTFTLGLEYAADFKAPRCLKVHTPLENGGYDDRCLKNVADYGAIDFKTKESLDNTFVWSDPFTGRYLTTNVPLQAFNITLESTLYLQQDSQKQISSKLYSNMAKFIKDDQNLSFSLGNFTTYTKPTAPSSFLKEFNLLTEYRLLNQGFRAGYFDTTYEIDKYEYLNDRQTYAVNATKYQTVFGDPENLFFRDQDARAHGLRLELGYSLYDQQKNTKFLEASLGLMDSTRNFDSQFFINIRSQFWHRLQFFLTYLRLNYPQFSDLWKISGPNLGSNMVILALRCQIFSFLFLNLNYSRNYQITQSPGSEYHLGKLSNQDPKAAATFGHTSLFKIYDTLFIRLEFGKETAFRKIEDHAL